jgi:enamine deaminase RidA (YjgF/YER057c/UK114 family)
MTDAFRYLRPDGWAAPSGYSDGVSASGRMVVLAGQIGWNPVTAQFETDDLGEQTAQALRNVVAVLAAGDARPEHLVRLTWYVTDRDAYLAARSSIGAAYRKIVGDHYPAMSLIIVAGLLEPRAKVEIEATAIVPPSNA